MEIKNKNLTFLHDSKKMFYVHKDDFQFNCVKHFVR